MELSEWLINFIKHKDLIKKTIEKIEQKEDLILVKHKDKNHIYLIVPFIDDIKNVIKKLNDEKKDGHCSLVIYNSKQNLKIIIDNWNKLVKNPKLSIYFVNPESTMDKKWIIFPHTHNKITEKTALKPGLNALFSNVEEIKRKN